MYVCVCVDILVHPQECGKVGDEREREAISESRNDNQLPTETLLHVHNRIKSNFNKTKKLLFLTMRYFRVKVKIKVLPISLILTF